MLVPNYQDLAETNLVNLTILISLIVYFGKQFLTDTLRAIRCKVYIDYKYIR